MFRLHCKKTKILANSTAPIYLRISIESSRIEFTTRRYINAAPWNTAVQEMTVTNEQARSLNQYLKILEQQVYNAHRQMIELKQPVTVNSLKEKVFETEKPAEVKTLIPIFKDHHRRALPLLRQYFVTVMLVDLI